VEINRYQSVFSLLQGQISGGEIHTHVAGIDGASLSATRDVSSHPVTAPLGLYNMSDVLRTDLVGMSLFLGQTVEESNCRHAKMTIFMYTFDFVWTPVDLVGLVFGFALPSPPPTNYVILRLTHEKKVLNPSTSTQYNKIFDTAPDIAAATATRDCDLSSHLAHAVSRE
jgi:hypothetical protein